MEEHCSGHQWFLMVTCLGNVLFIGQHLKAHCNFFKDEAAQRNGDLLGNYLLQHFCLNKQFQKMFFSCRNFRISKSGFIWMFCSFKLTF
jgi:hypothetical protein